MGTSTGYKMPTGGDWTPLKNDATDFVQNGPGISAVAPRQLIREYLGAIGGSPGISGNRTAHGGGSGSVSGSGTRSSSGRSAATRVGSGIAGFLSGVGSAGLAGALRDLGLEHLVGCSAADLSSGLLDALAGPASTIDDAAARAALAALNELLLADATTADEVEQSLTRALDDRGLGNILGQFFGLYIFERFCRDFYERWVKSAGQDKARNAFKSVKSYIESALKSRTVNIDATKVVWNGPEGANIIGDVLRDTCEVFGVPT